MFIPLLMGEKSPYQNYDKRIPELQFSHQEPTPDLKHGSM